MLSEIQKKQILTMYGLGYRQFEIAKFLSLAPKRVSLTIAQIDWQPVAVAGYEPSIKIMQRIAAENKNTTP
jgi:hypothetical protein